MSTQERWHITHRKVPGSLIYRGKLYRLDDKYMTLPKAESHAEYLKMDAETARRPYKGKRAPFKQVATVIRKILDEKRRTWYAVYERKY